MGFVDGWYTTAKKIIINPKDFFKTMPTTEGHHGPLKFAIINFFIASLLSLGFVIVLYNTRFQQGVAMFGNGVTTYLISITISSVIRSIVILYISAVVFHIFLKIVGAKKNLICTFSVIAYLSVFDISISIINIDHVVTTVIAYMIGIYLLYLKIVGFKEVHDITLTRTLIAVLTPLIIILIFAGLLYILLNPSTFNVFSS